MCMPVQIKPNQNGSVFFVSETQKKTNKMEKKSFKNNAKIASGEKTVMTEKIAQFFYAESWNQKLKSSNGD